MTLLVGLSLYVTDGTLQDKRGSSALLLHTTEEPRVRDLCLLEQEKEALDALLVKK